MMKVLGVLIFVRMANVSVQIHSTNFVALRCTITDSVLHAEFSCSRIVMHLATSLQNKNFSLTQETIAKLALK